MRKLEFRVWDEDIRAMITTSNSDQFAIGLSGELIDVGCVFTSQIKKISKGVIAEQFTGLLDKKGTKIFEGDIIKSSPRCRKDTGMFSVHYDCVYASFTCHHIEWLGLCVSSPESYPLGECRFDIEVI